MLSDFESYRLANAEINDLTELSGAVVAIEAGFFLKRLLEKEDGLPYEGLVSATGGIPYHLRSFIEDDLEKFKTAGVDVLFVFDGLDAGKKFTPFSQSNNAVEKCGRAWSLYDGGMDSEQARQTFRQTGALKVESGYGLLQSILKERNIPFKVAPYKAIAQIAYLYQHGTDYIDAVAGPYDLLLYDVDRVIVHLNMQQDRFSFIDRNAWLAELGSPSHEQFVDACVLTGTSFCRPMPSKLDRKLPETLNLMRMNGETGLGLCRTMESDPVMVETEYVDRYRRARLKIKHSIVLTTDGKVEPITGQDVPMDIHELVGQHLPDELYYYLSIGALGPRLLNDVSSSEIHEQVPLDGGASDEYRNLVSDKLMPLKQTALSLLAKWLHRAYFYREYTYRFWYDESRRVMFKPVEVGEPDVKVKSWRVSQATLESSPDYARRPSLAFAVQSLSDTTFAVKTVASPDAKTRAAIDGSAIAPNVLWRFLHLRQYINDKHELTPWGKVLNTIISSFKIDLTTELEDAALLATELLRHNLLTSTDYWPTYAKPSEDGSYQDKQNRTLLSRVACLGTLSHSSRGYSGRLSRRILGYNRMVTAVQSSLRDLLESCFATLLLSGDTPRDGDIDLTTVGQALPLATPLNDTLGIAVHHYLEQVDNVAPDFEAGANKDGEERKNAWKDHLRTVREQSFLVNATNVAQDLDKAWIIWDAVFAGVKVAADSGLIREKMVDEWSGIDAWLAKRR